MLCAHSGRNSLHPSAGLRAGQVAASKWRERSRVEIRGAKTGKRNVKLHGTFPLRCERRYRKGQILPVNNERTGEWPVVRGIDQARADGVFKNVRSYAVEPLAGAKNVVVMVPLPEIAYPQRASVRSRHAFERSNGFGKIRRFCQRCGKNVTMIRHEAIGENGETMTAKLPADLAHQQRDQTWIGEELVPLICANRQKAIARA